MPAQKSGRGCRATKHCLRTRFLRESGNHSQTLRQIPGPNEHTLIGSIELQKAQLLLGLEPSAMFFLHELERTITLHPSFFGPKVEDYLKNKLREDVEGTCTGSYYIICVLDSHDISEGRCVPGSALAEYTVHYRAVVWRPFKGETVGLVALFIP